jgi:hypothetical protein
LWWLNTTRLFRHSRLFNTTRLFHRSRLFRGTWLFHGLLCCLRRCTSALTLVSHLKLLSLGAIRRRIDAH